MKKITIFATLMLLIVSIFGCKKLENDQSLKIFSIIGDVKIIQNTVAKTPNVGDIIQKDDEIITGDMSVADLLLGEEGVIRVQQNSHIKMASVINKTSTDTQIDMDNGKVYITLSKMRKGTFKVKTPTAVASVRGTSFRVTAGENKSKLDVLVGKIKVNPIKDEKVIEEIEAIVEKNQTVEIDKKAVENAIEKKEEIKVAELKKEEIKEIKNEVKNIKPEIVEKLGKEAKKEINENILKQEPDTDDSAEEKDLLQKKQQRQLALKLAKEKQTKINRENKSRLEAERKERLKKEREKKIRDRAANVPTL